MRASGRQVARHAAQERFDFAEVGTQRLGHARSGRGIGLESADLAGLGVVADVLELEARRQFAAQEVERFLRRQGSGQVGK